MHWMRVTTMTQITVILERNFMFVYIVDKFLCDKKIVFNQTVLYRVDGT